LSKHNFNKIYVFIQLEQKKTLIILLFYHNVAIKLLLLILIKITENFIKMGKMSERKEGFSTHRKKENFQIKYLLNRRENWNNCNVVNVLCWFSFVYSAQ
jgi:hypothetical protein